MHRSRRNYGAASLTVPDAGSQSVDDGRDVLDDRLTEREQAAALLLAYGHTNRDVARELRVSVRTAESDRARLMRKLGLARRAELVQWALQRGLLR